MAVLIRDCFLRVPSLVEGFKGGCGGCVEGVVDMNDDRRRERRKRDVMVARVDFWGIGLRLC